MLVCTVERLRITVMLALFGDGTEKSVSACHPPFWALTMGDKDAPEKTFAPPLLLAFSTKNVLPPPTNKRLTLFTRVSTLHAATPGM